MRLGALIAAGIVAVWAGACATRGGGQPAPAEKPLPAYADLAGMYNERCADLDRLKAAVSLTIEAPDGKGGRRKDQVEAYLQLAQPSKVSLRVDKVGQTLAVLGSDDERYWWIDLADEPRAHVGRHAKARPTSAAAFGIPVQPLDLVDVLGVRPLPASGATVARAVEGTVAVTLPARAGVWGVTRIYVDEATWTPERIEIMDAAGNVVVRSALSMYVPVKVAGNTFSPARVASRLTIELPGQGVTIGVGVASPENPKGEMRMKPFEFETLQRAYGVESPIDVDAGGAP